MHALARRSCFCFSASGEIICVFSSIGLIIYRHSIEDIHWFRKSLMTISVVFRRSRLNAWQAYTVGIVLLSLSLLVGWDQSQFPKQLSMSWSYRTAVLVIVSYEFPRCISERCLPGMVSFAFFAPDIEDQTHERCGVHPSSLLSWIFCLGDACRRNMFMMNAIGGSGPHFHTERRAAP